MSAMPCISYQVYYTSSVPAQNELGAMKLPETVSLAAQKATLGQRARHEF